MVAYFPVDFNWLKTLAKTVSIPARQNQFTHENVFNNAPVRRIDIAMNTKSAFTGSYTKNPFLYQQFEIDLKQVRMLRGAQPTIASDAADNCRLNVTTMKAMDFQDDIPSTPFDKFIDPYVLVFHLTSIQDAAENFPHPEIVGEQLRLELKITSPLEHVTELIVLRERMSSAAVDKFGVVEKEIKNGWFFPPAINQPYFTTQISAPSFFSFWLCSNSW